MTAAALSQSPEPYEVPEGGLASFLTATVGDWSDDALNAENYYDIVKPTAEQLAAFGREEDDRIAHVATGETVIPMAVFEEDPALKEALFARMRDMGIEPERYVVGSELNSINPVTGQPEFFLKKIFKGIKKAVKGVVKVFKKIAPLVLSVGLNFLFPGLGAIASGALGSGIGTLVQGGSIKDAFKAALIGGAVGGISSGIGSVMKGGDFMSGVKGALPGGSPVVPAPIEQATPDFVAETATAAGPANVAEAAVQEAAAGVGAPITPAQAIQQPDILGQLQSGQFTTDASGAIVRKAAQPDILGQLQSGQFTTDASGTIVPKESLIQGPDAAVSGADVAGSGAGDAVAQLTSSGLQQTADRTFFERIGDYMFRGGQTPAEIQAAITSARSDTVSQMLKDYGFESLSQAGSAAPAIIKAAEAAAAKAGPGLFAKYGPMTALGLGVAGVAGAFEPRPMPEPFDFYGGLTGFDLLRQNPDQYFHKAFNRDAQGNLLPASGPGYAANGGDISHFPRKNGPINGPGTETSDDIPAMLSDGEFVMTARAVRGAGNGSRQDGMRRMYDMMRTFEGRAARGN